MEPGVLSYVVFLIIGVALVFVDGRLIRRSGETYLEEVYPDPKVADSVNRLITVLFHLAVLGILALFSTAEMNVGSPIETVVARTGVMLLVLAVAHAITIWALSRIRSRQREQRMKAELTTRAEERMEQDRS
ncbi:hypothetical protein [Haloactinomyces albus]|uniref:Signal transduction histidine kinase n=1 Tax=Haloactinomyces albus TaxID=1352928 RepID=A0AAE4CLR8_9ACTN|nr:hypothetical protein [Haloactinomyces albus]MDR7302124.1 signal transduction histidine kinase [Haloactinomyces albus]